MVRETRQEVETRDQRKMGRVKRCGKGSDGEGGRRSSERAKKEEGRGACQLTKGAQTIRTGAVRCGPTTEVPGNYLKDAAAVALSPWPRSHCLVLAEKLGLVGCSC